MTNLEQIIDYTQVFQDIELASAISSLKKDPAQLQMFLQDQQNNVYNNIVTQKDNTFQKVYGDLNRASKVQESILMYNKRSGELSNIQQQIADNQENSASAITEDKNNAGRKNEMNEWSINNKNDTLFVFSSLFIMLSCLLLITVLWRMGIISSYFWVALGAPMIIIFILIVIRRSFYTDNLRNKRYWNKQIFEGKYGKIPIPSSCPGALDGIQNGISSLGHGLQSGMGSVAQGVASATQNVAQGMSSFSQQMAPATATVSAPAPAR